jgi:hypothetical protein
VGSLGYRLHAHLFWSGAEHLLNNLFLDSGVVGELLVAEANIVRARVYKILSKLATIVYCRTARCNCLCALRVWTII